MGCALIVAMATTRDTGCSLGKILISIIITVFQIPRKGEVLLFWIDIKPYKFTSLSKNMFSVIPHNKKWVAATRH